MRTVTVKAFEKRKATMSPEYIAQVLAHSTVADGVMTIDDVAIRALNKTPVRGLGDVAARVFQPFARGIDAVAGTFIEGCGSCAKNKDKLNKAVPLS